jgi:hypothetical protein
MNPSNLPSTDEQTNALHEELREVLGELWQRMQTLPPDSIEYRQLAEYHARQVAELDHMVRTQAELSRILNPPRGLMVSVKNIAKLLALSLLFSAAYIAFLTVSKT